MKVSLANKTANATVYGMKFDENGVCDVDKKVAQSLLDTGVLVEVVAKKAAQ